MSIALRQEAAESAALQHLGIVGTSREGESWTCRLERGGEADAMAAKHLGLHLHGFIERSRDAAPDGRATGLCGSRSSANTAPTTSPPKYYALSCSDPSVLVDDVLHFDDGYL